jgi:hypothetical protein
VYPKLHLWYGRDRGKTVEKEFLEILVKFAGEEVRSEAVGEEG